MIWKEICIFVSSTFNDMQAERDFIARNVVGRLNSSLEKYHICVRLLDLRWGIDTHQESEEQYETKVLHVCMDLIRNTRPYFIALLGHRYGWIPSSSKQSEILRSFLKQDGMEMTDTINCSITEMEILLGALGREDYLDHSFFFFRDEESYKGMDLDTICNYDDRQSPDESVRSGYYSRLLPLKEKICRVCNKEGSQRVFPYLCTWNGNKMTNLNELGETIYKLLFEDIIKQINSGDENIPESVLQDAFCQNKKKCFSGREGLLDKIIHHIEQYTINHTELNSDPKERPVNGIVLYGPAGCGKSSIYGELVNRLGQDKRFCLKYASCGLSTDSSSLSTIEDYWDKRWGTNEQIVESGRRCVYLLDSVESAACISEIADKFTKYLETINPYILTCTEECLDTLKQEICFYQRLSYRTGDCKFIRIPDVTEIDADKVISTVLGYNFKQLSHTCRKALLSHLTPDKNSSEFLFWLRIALSVLMEFSSEDFRKIHILEADNDSDKIEMYLMQTIESFPNSLDKMLMYYIHLTSSYFNRNMTNSFLYYLTSSRYGLSVQNFEELLGDNWNSLEFENLVYWLREFIHKDNYTGKLTIGHRLFRRVIDNNRELDTDIVTLFKRLYGDGKIDDCEYLYMIIRSGDVCSFHDYMHIDNGYLPDAVPPVLSSFVKDDEESCFAFLSNYFSRYRSELLNGELVFSISWGLTDASDEAVRLMTKAKSSLLQQFSEKDLRNGDMNVLHAYFEFCNSKFNFEFCSSIYICDLPPFNVVKQVYIDNKILYGSLIAQRWLPRTFFCLWADRIKGSSNIEEYLYFENECRWFCEKANSIVDCIDLYQIIWANGRVIRPTSESLYVEEKLRILRIVQSDYYSLLTPEMERDSFLFSQFLQVGVKLVDYYRELHRWGVGLFFVTPFVPTQLSCYLDKMVK